MTITGKFIPNEVVENILKLFQDNEEIIVLQLNDKYMTKYGTPINPDEYGFSNLYSMLKHLQKEGAGIQTFFNDMYHLWAVKLSDG